MRLQEEPNSLISVRDLTEADIPMVLGYWFHSPPGFIEGMGVDLAKMPTEPIMEKNLREKVAANRSLSASKLNALVIMHGQTPIGLHTINPLIEGDYGIFHAHIIDPKFRGRGIGLQSYPKACRIFLERFDLKKIVFKTPLRNVGAIRVKEKLGIRQIGEEVIGFSIIRDGTPAKVFEWTREEIERKWPRF